MPAVFHLNGLDPRLSQIIAPLQRTITDEETRGELNQFAREYQQELVVNRGLGEEARVLRAIIGLHNAGQVLRMGAIANEANREEGGEPLTAKMVGNIVRGSLRLPVHQVKGRYQVRWDQAKIDALVGYYGLGDDEYEVGEEEESQVSLGWEEG